MPQILVVCTANICRSPVAAALLKQKLDENGRASWNVQSAGTWAMVKRSPARFSIQLMAEQGIDISQNYAQMVTADLMAQADLILCMETGHVEALQIEFPQYRDRIFTLSEMADKPYSIPDPYGSPLAAYQEMVTEVTRLVNVGFPRIVRLTEENASKR